MTARSSVPSYGLLGVQFYIAASVCVVVGGGTELLQLKLPQS